MKKIIYGLIVLLGIGFISTNFIVDTSTLDHKTVKAGGTACKWVSDTGHGVGPVYVDTGSVDTVFNWDSKKNGNKYYKNTIDFYDMAQDFDYFFLGCSSNNSGVSLSANKLYDQNGVLATFSFKQKFSSSTHNHITGQYLIYCPSKECNEMTESDDKIIEEYSVSERWDSVAFGAYALDGSAMLPEPSNLNYTVWSIYNQRYKNRPNKYTCVCAEY